VKSYLGRRYRLSASHRLHSERLSDEQNRAVYGKCANPHGHGHNYTVEVVVGGVIHPETGMVCDLVELDACVGREVLEPFDHENLNTLAAFQNLVPTTENLCIEIERRLRRGLRRDLSLVVRVEETSNNFFEFRSSDAPATGAAQG
jgi:6-pyruvoyltetrahydropterin/6-carboxytetrahydropterin synthase